MSIRPITAKCAWILLPCILLAGVLGAQAQQEQPEPPTAVFTGTAEAVHQGQAFSVPFRLTALGPLFSLQPLAARLGGGVETALKSDGVTLTLAETEFLLAPGSPVMVVGQEIVQLSQAPQASPTGLQVPMDLLERTFGEVLGLGFEWSVGDQSLAINRLLARELPVVIDAVHLRGTTTLALQFPESVRYRLVERPAGVDVELIGDRIEQSFGPAGYQDPLVQRIRVTRERIQLDLAPGTVANSYQLDGPFRIVVDLHEGSSASVQPTSPSAGDAGPALPSRVSRSPNRLRTIVLDPGHGGEHTGAIGPGGTVEKSLTLQLARELERALERRLPVRVILTRDGDEDLDLDARAAFANETKADLFISIHLNASLGRSAAGAETYFLSREASDTSAAESAAFENLEGMEGVDPLDDLTLMLWDLAQTGYMTQSRSLAGLIQEELNGSLGLRDRGVKQAPFRVLMGAAMPAVLIEYGFLSNPEEERRLKSPAYRSELVEATVRAVLRYQSQLQGAAEASEEDSP